MNRPLALIALLGLATVTACSTGGTPSPTSTTTATRASTDQPPSTTSSASAAADPLARTDPCTLLPQAVISQNGLHKEGPGIGPAVRYCRWATPGTLDPQYNIQVGIYDTAGLNDLNRTDFTVSDYPVNGRPGALSKDSSGGSACLVSLAVTSTSRVDVDLSVSNASQTISCAIAEAAAPSVEKNLPPWRG